MGLFFIISTSGPPSLLFQRVRSLLYHFNGWSFFIFSTGAWAPSLLFHRVGPFLYYFKGCIGPCSFVLTFRWLLIDSDSSLTFALTIAKLYVFKFEFSKSVWGFREPLSQIFPLLYSGLRPRLGLCRHFGIRLLHEPNLWEQLCYSQTHRYMDGSCSGEKRPESEWRDCNTQNFLTLGGGETSSKTTRQVTIIKVGYVLNVL